MPVSGFIVPAAMVVLGVLCAVYLALLGRRAFLAKGSRRAAYLSQFKRALMLTLLVLALMAALHWLVAPSLGLLGSIA